MTTATAHALADLVRTADSVVALTGAGISVPSGIPDFRSPGSGLWENVNPMEVAHIDAWRADPERFWHFYGNRFQTLQQCRALGCRVGTLEETAAERMLSDLKITKVSYDAPVQAVWDAWTDPKQLAKWFPPEGFTLRTMAARIAEVGDLWAEMIGAGQSLEEPIAALQARPR